MRPAIDCTFGAIGSTLLDSQLLQFVESTCGLPENTFVMVRFVSGCPAVLQVMGVNSESGPSFVACLTNALSDQRWACAEMAGACSMVEVDTLP